MSEVTRIAWRAKGDSSFLFSFLVIMCGEPRVRSKSRRCFSACDVLSRIPCDWRSQGDKNARKLLNSFSLH